MIRYAVDIGIMREREVVLTDIIVKLEDIVENEYNMKITINEN